VAVLPYHWEHSDDKARRYKRFDKVTTPVRDGLHSFNTLHHLVIPYRALLGELSHNEQRPSWASVPRGLHTLEVIRPYPKFRDFLSALVQNRHHFPNLKTVVSYHGKQSDFPEDMYLTMEARDPIWRLLEEAGIFYTMRSEGDLDLAADRSEHILHIKELSR
jgi:hypothetical protein